MGAAACPRCTELADEVARLRKTLGFYRWWLWEVVQALHAARAPRTSGGRRCPAVLVLPRRIPRPGRAAAVA